MADVSVRNETRQKFDALLKNALNKKKRKSKQNLMSDDSSAESANETEKEATPFQRVHVDIDGEDEENKTFILDKFLNDNSDVAPIPKPRQKRENSAHSNETYKVASRKHSSESNRTYCVESNSSSAKSHSINERKKSKQGKKYDSDVDINTKSDSSSSIYSKDTNSSISIRYENEINPKPRKRVVEKIKTENVESIYSYEKVMAITVHSTDRLQLTSYVVHPVIKIHAINGETGEYLRKTDANRSAVLHCEDKKIPYLMPILTQPFSLQDERMLYPVWEETILINEDINYFLNKETNAMLFFELIDFMSFSTACAQYSQKGTSNGWHRIAWAFLKIVGQNNALNIEKKLRLQFYVPQNGMRTTSERCEAFFWWKRNKLVKYPSTLYVTIKSMSPQKLVDTFNSKSHRRSCKYAQNSNAEQIANSEATNIKDNNISWSKLLHKKCLLPNSCVAKLESFEEGCFVLKFSHNGLYLAYSVLIRGTYSIIVFSITSMEETYRFPGHQHLIHSICWSRDDKIIVSASADGTVCIWHLEKRKFIQMLSHPSFVYSAEITSTNMIITGCFDQTLRVWNKIPSKEYVLIQELNRHKGYITTICSNKSSNILFSADSQGVIVQWQCNEENNLVFRREINILDIKGTIINNIILHRKEKRLLIHSRDNALRLLDLKTAFVLHWLKNNNNNRIQIFSCFSYCGSFVLSGSENGLVNVWNAHTGKPVASYLPYSNHPTNSIPIHCVAFHPHDNLLAVSHYGKRLPILLYKYEDEVEEKVNLRVIDENALRSKLERVETRADVKELVRGKQEKVDFKNILQKMDQIIIDG